MHPFTGLFLTLLAGRPCRTANAEGTAGTHAVLTRRADAAHPDSHLLVRAGSDAGHVALGDASHYPLGLTTDQPEQAEDILNVSPLGTDRGTRKVRCATALGADADLYAAAGGMVQGEPATAGTYYLVGRSVQAAQAVESGYLIEFAPCRPLRLTVAATPASVANIATALAAPGLVKFL